MSLFLWGGVPLHQEGTSLQNLRRPRNASVDFGHLQLQATATARSKTTEVPDQGRRQVGKTPLGKATASSHTEFGELHRKRCGNAKRRGGREAMDEKTGGGTVWSSVSFCPLGSCLDAPTAVIGWESRLRIAQWVWGWLENLDSECRWSTSPVSQWEDCGSNHCAVP